MKSIEKKSSSTALRPPPAKRGGKEESLPAPLRYDEREREEKFFTAHEGKGLSDLDKKSVSSNCERGMT